MKIKVTKIVSSHLDQSEIGIIHLTGFRDSTACGLANEDFDKIETHQELTCITCKEILEWTKKISKIKK